MKTSILLLLLLLLAGCTSAPAPTESPSATSTPLASDTVHLSQKARELVQVRVEPVTWGTLRASLRLAGHVGAAEDSLAEVVSPVAGRLMRLDKKTGELVAAGAPLAQIQSPELMKLLGQIQATQARLAAARQALARRQQMAALGVFSEEHYEEAHVGMIKAQEELRVARSQLEQSRQALRRQQPLAKEGLISRLDLEALQSQVRVHEAALARAQSMHAVGREHMQRETKVLRQDHWSMRELEEARSKVEEQQAELDGLLATWRAAGGGEGLNPVLTLRAPIRGWVLERKGSPGDWADTEHPLFRLADLRRVWVVAEAREADLPALREGGRVEVRGRFSRRVYSGRIRSVAREVQPDKRFLPVIVEVQNPSEELRPGMTVDAELELAAESGPLVPEAALLKDGDDHYVFVEEGADYRRKKVDLGPVRDGRALVRKGLAKNERLVVSGQQQLQAETVRSSLGESQE